MFINAMKSPRSKTETKREKKKQMNISKTKETKKKKKKNRMHNLPGNRICIITIESSQLFTPNVIGRRKFKTETEFSKITEQQLEA